MHDTDSGRQYFRASGDRARERTAHLWLTRITGNTPAAWTAVCVALVAFLVGAVGLVIGNWPTFWVGVALLAVSVVVGKVMQAMGLGAG